jgi:hypothetical protein
LLANPKTCGIFEVDRQDGFEVNRPGGRMSIQAWWNVRLAVVTATGMVVVAGVAPHVHGGPISYSVIEPDSSGRWIERLVEPGEIDAVPQGEMVENYDNWRSPTFWDGQTVFTGQAVQVGDREVGDDLRLVNYGGGIVDSVGISRKNLATERFMGDFDLDISFYRASDLHQIGQILVTVVGGGLDVPPGGARLTYFGFGTLRRFNLVLENDIYMTVRYSNVQGVRPEDVGQLIGGPVTTGFSSSIYRDFTLGQNLDLGETPQMNLGMSVRTVVPSPGVAVVLLGLGVMFPRQHRRLRVPR